MPVAIPILKTGEFFVSGQFSRTSTGGVCTINGEVVNPGRAQNIAVMEMSILPK
jgi:hypothetical protein